MNLYSLALADVCPCNVPFMMRRLNKGKSTSGKQGSESVFRLRQDGWTMDAGGVASTRSKQDKEESAGRRGIKRDAVLMLIHGGEVIITTYFRSN